jgi:hypothetical protein
MGRPLPRARGRMTLSLYFLRGGSGFVAKGWFGAAAPFFPFVLVFGFFFSLLLRI